MTTKSTHKIGISALTLLLSITAAHADQIAWDNSNLTTGTSGLWSTGTNWFNNTSNTDTNTIPAAIDDVRLGRFSSANTRGFPLNAAYTIDLAGNRIVSSLILDHQFGGILNIGASGTTNILTLTSGNITRDSTTSNNTVFRTPIGQYHAR